MEKFMQVLAAASLSVVLPLCAIAEETLRFCYDPYPPYSFGAEGPAEGGLNVALLQRVVSHIDEISATVTLMPWQRCQLEAQSGDFDGILPLLRNEERATYLAFTDETSLEAFHLFYRPDQFPDSLPFDGGFDQIGDLRLGMLSGGYISADLEAVFSQEQSITRARDAETLIQLLLAGRVDIIAMNKTVGTYYLTINQWEERVALAEVPISTRPVQFGLSRTSGADQYLEAFNAAIAEMQAAGEIQAILESTDYGSTN